MNDEAISNAMAATLELGDLSKRDKLLMQRKISNYGLGLCSMEKNLEFLFLAGFMRSISKQVNSTSVSTFQDNSSVHDRRGVRLRTSTC